MAKKLEETEETPKATSAATYTAYADFDFKYNRKNYAYKRGDSFTPPEGMVEVPGDPMTAGVTFQYMTYRESENEATGEKSEMEIPHYMILPLTRG